MGVTAVLPLLILLLVVVVAVVIVRRHGHRDRPRSVPAQDGSTGEPTAPTQAAGAGQCAVCFGMGRVNCPWCIGSGRKTCTQCGGSGQKFTGPSKMNPSGITRCIGCTGGRMTCTCAGGKVVCGACGGSGKKPPGAR